MHSQGKLKVAVVDDDELMRELICGMVNALDYQAVPLESAAALAKARVAQDFHALMLDLSMPDVDGFELIYKLAESQPVEPVIIVSSLSNDIRQAARLVCQSMGIEVLGVLSKPFNSEQLSLLLEARRG
jgi:CheY-like chemotaxis protein